MSFDYKHTHVSVEDSSPAMMISESPFVLINEDGETWMATPEQWREIPPPSRYRVTYEAQDASGLLVGKFLDMAGPDAVLVLEGLAEKFAAGEIWDVHLDLTLLKGEDPS